LRAKVWTQKSSKVRTKVLAILVFIVFSLELFILTFNMKRQNLRRLAFQFELRWRRKTANNLISGQAWAIFVWTSDWYACRLLEY